MKKRITLIATAALCALALCLCAIPALPVFAEGEEAEPAWIEGITATVTDPFYVDGAFHVNYLFDGDTAGFGWHAMPDGSIIPSVEAPTVIDANLNGTYEIWAIILSPMVGIYASNLSVVPPVFELQLSDDNGTTWNTVVTETEGYSTPDGAPLIYELDEPTEATNFRMLVQSVGPTVDGTILTGVGEIELWGIAVEGETETETETVTETETETETETVTETVVESTDESADESADESVDESVDESTDETTDETVGETVVGETTAETTAGTTAGTDAPAADEGCASVVGLGAVAVLTAAAAAVVLKKKD